MSDKIFSSVNLLCGFNGADAATAFTDESSAARVATFNGNAQLDTADSKWGSASLLLDGTGDFVTFPNNAALSISTGDFTIEAWVKITASKTHTITGKRDASGAEEHTFQISAGGLLIGSTFNGSALLNMQGLTVIALNTWTHVAFSRIGSTGYLHVNGHMDATGSEGGTPATNTGVFYVGRDGFNSARDFQGWIDEVRFTKVTGARYGASDFAVPQGPFSRQKNLGTLTKGRQPVILLAA